VTDLDAWMEEPINWDEFEEVTLSLLDSRGGEPDMPRHTHGKGVRARPEPKPIKLPKQGK
jgi:hypothetical protein